MSGNNEVLLETILCCLHLFSRYPCFYERCHVLYSVTTVIDLSIRLLDLKNVKLLCLAFNLLITLVSSDQYLMAASTQTSLLQQALKLIEKTCKVHNPHILLVVNKLLFHLLKKESFPSLKFPLPLSELCCIFNLCLNNAQRFLSSHLLRTSQLRDSFQNDTENLPIEVNILTSGMDVLYLFIRIIKQHDSKSMSMEEMYSCPVIESCDQLSKTADKISFHSIMPAFIAALDEIFVPCCLLLGSTSISGKISWCHIVNVLSVIFEDPSNNQMLIMLIQKLIKTRIMNHLWNIKIDEILIFDASLGGSKEKCNKCLNNMVKYILEADQVTKEYLSYLEDGMANMNCSIEECCSILSMNSESLIQNEECLFSMQATFLCLVYFSYLYEGPIINIKSLIPHLIYYVTCNADRFKDTLIIVKHLIFILSLQVWLKFIEYSKDTFLLSQAVKVVVHLLSSNNVALETFVVQFESNPEIRFLFLKKVYENEILECDDLIIKERFENVIHSCVQHLQIWISKLLIMKNHNELYEENSLSIGLECLLWCQQKINPTIPVDIKLLFHVTSFCCNTSLLDRMPLLPCLRYLQYAVKFQTDDAKAWHIITSNTNIVNFLQKSMTLKAPFKTETLCLLVLILEHQTRAGLKCNTHIMISLTQILKWMNCPETKILSFELVNASLDAEFREVFIQICPLQQNSQSLDKNLSRKDLRILALYLQNAIVLGNPVIEKVASASYEKLLNFISKTDTFLERHIMLQPWQRILLESKVDDAHNSLNLFEKWCNYSKENVTLIGVMNQYADTILDMPDFNPKMFNMGIYKKFIPKETILRLKDKADASSNSLNKGTEETDIILEIENYVANYQAACRNNITSV